MGAACIAARQHAAMHTVMLIDIVCAVTSRQGTTRYVPRYNYSNKVVDPKRATLDFWEA